MNFTTGFYTNICSIYYECNIEDGEEKDEEPNIENYDSKPNSFKSSFLGFYYVYSGELTVNYGGELIILPEKTLFVCPPNYQLHFVKSKINTELVCVEFHSSLINTFEKSEDLFKIFYTDEANKLIYTNEMHKDNIVAPLMNSLKSAVLQHYNEPFILSRVLTVITEINTVYDRFFGENEKEIPNVAVRVMDYIDRHYTEKLTIDSICEKFKISPSSVHRICKRAFNMTFKEKMAEMRLREGRALIIKKNYLPSSAAKIVGYKSYSSFFRAYKKAFGISPIDDLKSKQKWPMT